MFTLYYVGLLKMKNVIILLFEDEIVEVKELKQKLERFGYQVPYTTSTYEELFEKASAVKPESYFNKNIPRREFT